MCFLCVTTGSLHAQTEHMVKPGVADPLSGAPTNNHFAYTNSSVPQKSKLFLFFPGTGAVPFLYREVLKHAANLGYHAIGLCYPNSEAINSLCLTSTDTTCHSRARLEVIDGIDRHSGVNVDANNCIQRRTLKLLHYLHAAFPSEGWSTYFTGDSIQWKKIIVSGHSQGGGHAGLIGKTKTVDRVVMFAAMDWMFPLDRTAGWISWKGATSPERFYGFSHEKDESVDWEKLTITWKDYGITALGPLVLTDTDTSPYGNSHTLYTRVTPANDTTKYHGCIIADAVTPMSGGAPVLAPVWTYLIDGVGASTDLGEHGDEPNDSDPSSAGRHLDELHVYPQPATSRLRIGFTDTNDRSTSVSVAGSRYVILSIHGEHMSEGTVGSEGVIDVRSLCSGSYLLVVDHDGGRQQAVFVKGDGPL
jgi:hypothetical protein